LIQKAANTFAWGNTWTNGDRVLKYYEPAVSEVRSACN